MSPIDFGPYKISAIQPWKIDSVYRILKRGSAGRPFEPMRCEEGRELRFASYNAAFYYLLENALITMEPTE